MERFIFVSLLIKIGKINNDHRHVKRNIKYFSPNFDEFQNSPKVSYSNIQDLNDNLN